MTAVVRLFCTRTDERRRLSQGSPEAQTRQSQAITGTPCEVPVPRKVILSVNLGAQLMFVGVKDTSFFALNPSEMYQYPHFL